MKVVIAILCLIIGFETGLFYGYFLRNDKFAFPKLAFWKAPYSSSNLSMPNIPKTTNQPSCPTVPYGAAVPIFMYHHIKVNTNPYNTIETSLDVSPEAFDDQMNFLYKNNFHSISLSEYYSKITSLIAPSCGSFVLTFDDGYSDFYTNAYPILKKYQFTATVFPITNLINKQSYLKDDQIKEMQDYGITLGSHTQSHPNLTNTSYSNIYKELEQSRLILESNYTKPVTYLSFPSGKYNQVVIEQANLAGYVLAVTTNFNVVNKFSDLMQLNRVRISGGDSLNRFIEKLSPIKILSASNSN